MVSGWAYLPVEAPVVGRLWLVRGQLDADHVLDLLGASQGFCPRGAVGLGDYGCVELLMGNFLQRARIS